MRITTATILPLTAALAVAVPVVQHPLTGHHQIMLHEPGGTNPDSDPRRRSVWDNLPGRGGVRNAIEGMVDAIGQTLDEAVESISRTGQRALGQMIDEDIGRGRRGEHGPRPRPERTAWAEIRESRNSRRFAKLVEKDDRIRRMLDDPDQRLTVFVPTDEAFRQVERELSKYPEEFMKKVLAYHIVERERTTSHLLGVRTMPTLLQESELGHDKDRHSHHQRIRVNVGLTGMHLNFYSQIIASNIEANNAIMHAVDKLLIPPPRQGDIVEALPGGFSTFMLAMKQTGLARKLEDMEQRGGTAFVPTNTAWSKLGRAANSFLFSEKGKPYLCALLKYHVVANETLYSDALEKDEGQRQRRNDGDYNDLDDYDRRDSDNCVPYEMNDKDQVIMGNPDHRNHLDHALEDKFPKSHNRIEMPTMAKGRTLRVDISRWTGLAAIVVNGRYHVTIQDGIARDGVVHVVESVMMPPRHGGSRGHDEDEEENEDLENVEVSVEELKERLRSLIEGNEGGRNEL